MKRRSVAAGSLILSTVFAYGAVTDPTIGIIRYANGAVAALYGVHGNYIARQTALGSARALSFSEAGGLVANGRGISLLTPALSTVSSFESTEPAPVLSIGDTSDSALAWLPSRKAILHWTGTNWAVTPAITQLPDAEILSIVLENPNTAAMLLKLADGTVSKALVSLPTGELLSLLTETGVTGSAFEFRDWILFANGNQLKLQKSDGTSKLLSLHANISGDLQFERVSADDIHIFTATPSGDWLLHFGNGTVDLTELPALPSSVIAEVNQ